MVYMLMLPFVPLIALLFQNIFYLRGSYVYEEVSRKCLLLLDSYQV
jgi:hypothetical protein